MRGATEAYRTDVRKSILMPSYMHILKLVTRSGLI